MRRRGSSWTPAAALRVCNMADSFPTAASSKRRWIEFALGSLLMTHFVVVCAVKSSQSIPGDMLWMSHVSLAFAGAGLLLGSALFVHTALTAVAIPHLLWLIDFTAAAVTGEHPLRITHYLHDADAATWIATAHHFYLLPLLIIVVLRSGRYHFDAFGLAALLVILSTVISRSALPPSLNVNFAFRILPGVDVAPLHWVNGLPPGQYLIVQLAGQIGLMLLPTALLLRLLTRHALPVDSARSPLFTPLASTTRRGGATRATS